VVCIGQIIYRSTEVKLVDWKNKIIYGNALEVCKNIPTESISVVVTSPPYWAKRNYKESGNSLAVIWDENPELHCKHEWDKEVKFAGQLAGNIKLSGSIDQSNIECCDLQMQRAAGKIVSSGCFCGRCGAWYGQLGHEPTVSLYISHLIQIFNQIQHILRKDGNLFIVIGDTRVGGKHPIRSDNNDSLYAGRFEAEILPDMRPVYEMPTKSQCCVPELFKLAMISYGWIARSTYVWIKTNPKPESVNDRFTDCFEYIYHFVKHKDYYFNMQYEPIVSNLTELGVFRRIRGAFIGAIQPFEGAHFATFPTWLIKPLIKAGCPRQICSKCGNIAYPVYKIVKIKRNRLKEATESCIEAGQSPNVYAGITREFVGYGSSCACNSKFCSGTVFDPFMGVGTTALVAEELGFNWSGIELSKTYIKMAYHRLLKERRK